MTRDPGTPTEGRANNHKNGRERKGVHIVVYRRENVAIIWSAKSIPQGFPERSINPVLNEEDDEVEGGEGELADQGNHPHSLEW